MVVRMMEGLGLEDVDWGLKGGFLVSGFRFLVFFDFIVYCFPSEFDASFFLCISVTLGTTPSWSVYYVLHSRRLVYFMIPQYPFFLSELSLHPLVFNSNRILFLFVPLYTAQRRNYSLVTCSVSWNIARQC